MTSHVIAAETPKKAGPLSVAQTVLWSFFGVRRRREHESDISRLTPRQVVIAGLTGGVIFVVTIILVVRLVLHLATG